MSGLTPDAITAILQGKGSVFIDRDGAAFSFPGVKAIPVTDAVELDLAESGSALAELRDIGAAISFDGQTLTANSAVLTTVEPGLVRFSFAPILDPAQLFIDAVGNLSQAEQTAIKDLVSALIANGTWDKYMAIYPMVGGTAEAHKFNLKDPRDSDEAYRLTFTGETPFTHNSNGILTTTTGRGNTHLVPANIPGDYGSLHMYVRDYGGGMQLQSVDGNKKLSINLFSNTQGFIYSAGKHRDYSGYWDVNTTARYFSVVDASPRPVVYRDAVVPTSSIDESGFVNRVYSTVETIKINPDGESGALCSYIAIGESFTSAEISSDEAAVRGFQEALGRA